MKIAHVVDSMEVGGAERVVSLLCRLHRQAGHEPEVHCLFRLGSLGGELRREGIPVEVHGLAPRRQMPAGLYRRFCAAAPDVVHCHNTTATLLAAPVARLAGAGAVLATRHGLVRPPYPVRRELLFWLAARFCDHVIAVCSAVHQNLTNGCGAVLEKILMLRNGAAPAPLGAAAASVPKRGFTLVHVARLAGCKDQVTLLRAVALASQKVPDLRLWMIGEGPEKERLLMLSARLGLEQCVEFLGEREDVGRWLAEADLFVLSSLTEGLPVALLEAMAAGLPAIVTRVGGMPEVLRLSGAGKTVPPAQPAALAAAITEYATCRGELAALGLKARRCYERYFTAERMAEDYLRLYKDLLVARSWVATPPRPPEQCPALQLRMLTSLLGSSQ